MRKILLNPITNLLMVCAFATHPVLAATNLEDGIRLYNEKHYAEARPLLEKAVEEAPNAWQPHYYLANTSLALGKMSRAKYHYEMCKRTCKNAEILAHCQSGIARANLHTPASNSGSSPNALTPPTAEVKPTSDAEVAKERNRAHILKLAAEDCERIKKEAKEQLENEILYHGRRFKNTETGERKFDISEERKDEIQRECDEKCKKIMDEAKRRADSIR